MSRNKEDPIQLVQWCLDILFNHNAHQLTTTAAFLLNIALYYTDVVWCGVAVFSYTENEPPAKNVNYLSLMLSVCELAAP